MLYYVAFGCNSNTCSSETFHFSFFWPREQQKSFICIDLSKYRLITIFLEFFAYDL